MEYVTCYRQNDCLYSIRMPHNSIMCYLVSVKVCVPFDMYNKIDSLEQH